MSGTSLLPGRGACGGGGGRGGRARSWAGRRGATAKTAAIVSTGPWHVWHVAPAWTRVLWGTLTCSGTMYVHLEVRTTWLRGHSPGQPCEPYHAGKLSVNTLRASDEERHGLAAGLLHLSQILLGVRQRDEGRLELRKGEEHAPIEHGVEVAGVASRVRALGGGVIRHVALGEEAGEHGADAG